MTRNAEEPAMMVKEFGGIDRTSDIFDVPLGKWSEAWNTLTDGDVCRTRDGYRPITTRMFSKPFLIPPSWPDNQFWTRYGRDGNLDGGGGESTDGELTIVASPSHDIRLTAGPTVTVTFIAYMRGTATFSTYNWDFSYDGVTANADTSGAASSVTHAYTAEGTYTVRVWATGSDSKAYFATVTIQVLPLINTSSGNCTIEAWTDSPYIEEGSSADIQYRTVNATTVKINGRSMVVVNGGYTVTPTVTTTYELVASNGTGTDATTYVTVEVEPKDDGGTDDGGGTAILPRISAYPEPAQITTGGSSIIAWSSTNADTVTLDGASVRVSGVTEVSPTATTTYTFVATNTNGSTPASVEVKVGTEPTPTPGWLSLEDDAVEHNTNFDIVVSCYASGGTDAAVFPAAPKLQLIVTTPAGTTFTTDASPTANTDSTAYTFEDVQFDLPTGVDSAVCKLKAIVEGTQLVSREAEFTVVRKSADFLIECCNAAGTGITSIEVTTDGNTATATFYVRITARTVGTTNTLTTFDKDVMIDETVTGWPASPQIVYSQWCNQSNFADGTGVDIAGGDIPGEAFLGGDAGICTVKVIITTPLASWSDAHYTDLLLDVPEVYVG